jgi:hypothetical protein
MVPAYRYISADSHLEVAVDRWTPRMPKQYRDRAPRMVELDTGGQAWAIEGRPLRIQGLDLFGGKTSYGQNIQTHCSPTGYASTMMHAST